MSTAKGDGAEDRGQQMPRIFVIQDREIHRTRLAKVLALTHCQVIEVLPNASLPDDIENVDASPDLFVFPIDGADSTSLDRVRAVHAHEEFSDVPILGVARMKQLHVGLDELRSLGIVGVAEREGSVEHLAFRVSQLVRPSLQRRRWERIEVFFPVHFELDGVRTTELALSLSAGGIGLRCSRKVELNTDVRIVLEPEEGVELELEGRVVQAADDPRAFPRNRVAVVFYPASDETTARLERTVARFRSD